MFWLGLVVWGFGMVGLMCIIGAAERDVEAWERAVRPARRCYIEGDTDAEIAETLLRGLAKERVA